jgi:hypothetical protein
MRQSYAHFRHERSTRNARDGSPARQKDLIWATNRVRLRTAECPHIEAAMCASPKPKTDHAA